MKSLNQQQKLRRWAEDQGVKLMFDLETARLPISPRVPFSSTTDHQKSVAYLMKSLHIGTKFYVEEYEEHGRIKGGPDAQTKKDIWWPRCQAVIRYLNSNDGHSIFGECGKLYVKFQGDNDGNIVELPVYINMTSLSTLRNLEDILMVGFKTERGERWGAKEDCVSHLADALMNKQDEPVDESEVAPKTPPSYFNPKLKDLPAKRGPLATGSEEHNKRTREFPKNIDRFVKHAINRFGGFEGERGSLFDMSDYINLSPERELSLMQLEGPRQDENLLSDGAKVDKEQQLPLSTIDVSKVHDVAQGKDLPKVVDLQTPANDDSDNLDSGSLKSTTTAIDLADVVNNGINDNEKEEPRPKVFDPTNIKVMFQVYGEKG
ncbi:hypothetical protein BC829DRAFT_424288, partial [Chytridium lagenaria]